MLETKLEFFWSFPDKYPEEIRCQSVMWRQDDRKKHTNLILMSKNRNLNLAIWLTYNKPSILLFMNKKNQRWNQGPNYEKTTLDFTLSRDYLYRPFPQSLSEKKQTAAKTSKMFAATPNREIGQTTASPWAQRPLAKTPSSETYPYCQRQLRHTYVVNTPTGTDRMTTKFSR